MAERAPPTPLPDGVAFVKVGDARRALALAAAKFFPRQPRVIAAVTGTSGKTSVAAFTRQIWAALGEQAASIGTVGLVTPTREVYGSLTTPDPVALHRSLDELAGEGVTHLAIEASSHGLDQHRLDGVRVAAGGFTNLSRDHLDYHPTLEAYLAAKLRLFTDLIEPQRRGRDRCRSRARRRGGGGGASGAGCGSLTVGRRGEGIRLLDDRDRRLRAGADGRLRRPRLSRPPAAARRLPGRECAGRGRPRHCDRQRAGRRRSRRSRSSRAPRAGSSWSASATARRSSSTTPTSPTRSPRRSRRCGPMRRGRLIVVFGCGGDRDRRQAPDDGRDRGAAGRPRRRHRRQSAQRRTRRRSAPPSSRRRPARSRSATAARRSARRSRSCAAATCC